MIFASWPILAGCHPMRLGRITRLKPLNVKRRTEILRQVYPPQAAPQATRASNDKLRRTRWLGTALRSVWEVSNWRGILKIL